MGRIGKPHLGESNCPQPRGRATRRRQDNGYISHQVTHSSFITSITISTMPGPSSALRAPPAANTAPLPTASSSGQAAAPTPSAHSSTSMNASSSTSSTAALKDGAARPAPPPTKRLSLPRRLLNSYLQQLSKRPLRTKMITSTVLFCIGDSIAQFGIEGRRLPWMSPAMEEDEVPPSSSRPTGSELKTADKDSEWDVSTAAAIGEVAS